MLSFSVVVNADLNTLIIRTTVTSSQDTQANHKLSDFSVKSNITFGDINTIETGFEFAKLKK